jgi:hypothetical protein
VKTSPLYRHSDYSSVVPAANVDSSLDVTCVDQHSEMFVSESIENDKFLCLQTGRQRDSVNCNVDHVAIQPVSARSENCGTDSEFGSIIGSLLVNTASRDVKYGQVGQSGDKPED